MATVTTPLELRLYEALRGIAKQYDTPARIRKTSQSRWGLSAEEAIEMAYENIQADARSALRGVRLQTPNATAKS